MTRLIFPHDLLHQLSREAKPYSWLLESGFYSRNTLRVLRKVRVKSDAVLASLEGEIQRRGIEGFSPNNLSMVKEVLKCAESAEK